MVIIVCVAGVCDGEGSPSCNHVCVAGVYAGEGSPSCNRVYVCATGICAGEGSLSGNSACVIGVAAGGRWIVVVVCVRGWVLEESGRQCE